MSNANVEYPNREGILVALSYATWILGIPCWTFNILSNLLSHQVLSDDRLSLTKPIK
jgi:hypothetical protein